MAAKSPRSDRRAPHGPGRRKRTQTASENDSQRQSSPHEVNVGRRLRTLRDERDLSARAVAEKSGLAVNTLSLIETGKTSPSVSTLQRIAVALDVPITDFFDIHAPETRISHVRAGQRPRAAFAHGTLEDLNVGMRQRAVEPFVVTLEPHLGSGLQAIVHTGYEFVFCLEGRLAYTIEEHTYLLEPGDSLLFESTLPHRWQNVDAGPSRAILVLCPMDERDRPTERHFVQNEAHR